MTSTLSRPNTERRTRSYSQFSDYLHCGWAYRLKRIKKIPERPSVWLAGGKAFHTVSEQFDLLTWQENDLSGYADAESHEAWGNAFEQEFTAELDTIRENNPDADESTWRTAGRKTKDKPNGEDIAWWLQAGRDMVRQYIDWRVLTNDNLRIAAVEGGPGIEVEVSVRFGDVPVIQFIDRLMEDPRSGELLLMDLKSGSRLPTTPMQLAQYSVALEPVVGRPIVWGAFYEARKGQLSEPIDLSQFTSTKLATIYQNLDRGIDQGVFLPAIDSHCKSCGVRSACIFQPGGVEPS